MAIIDILVVLTKHLSGARPIRVCTGHGCQTGLRRDRTATIFLTARPLNLNEQWSGYHADRLHTKIQDSFHLLRALSIIEKMLNKS